jgi:hypothetical protein
MMYRFIDDGLPEAVDFESNFVEVTPHHARRAYRPAVLVGPWMNFWRDLRHAFFPPAPPRRPTSSREGSAPARRRRPSLTPPGALFQGLERGGANFPTLGRTSAN